MLLRACVVSSTVFFSFPTSYFLTYFLTHFLDNLELIFLVLVPKIPEDLNCVADNEENKILLPDKCGFAFRNETMELLFLQGFVSHVLDHSL